MMVPFEGTPTEVGYFNEENWLTDTDLDVYIRFIEGKLGIASSSCVAIVGPLMTALVKSDPVMAQSHFNCEEMKKKWLVLFIINNYSLDDGERNGDHWSLLVYSKRERVFVHIDSVDKSGSWKDALQVARSWCQVLKRNKSSVILQKGQCTMQDNFEDCGFYVLANAERIIKHFKQHGKVLTTNLDQPVDVLSMRRILNILNSKGQFSTQIRFEPWLEDGAGHAVSSNFHHVPMVPNVLIMREKIFLSAPDIRGESSEESVESGLSVSESNLGEEEPTIKCKKMSWKMRIVSKKFSTPLGDTFHRIAREKHGKGGIRRRENLKTVALGTYKGPSKCTAVTTAQTNLTHHGEWKRCFVKLPRCNDPTKYTTEDRCKDVARGGRIKRHLELKCFVQLTMWDSASEDTTKELCNSDDATCRADCLSTPKCYVNLTRCKEPIKPATEDSCERKGVTRSVSGTQHNQTPNCFVKLTRCKEPTKHATEDSCERKGVTRSVSGTQHNQTPGPNCFVKLTRCKEPIKPATEDSCERKGVTRSVSGTQHNQTPNCLVNLTRCDEMHFTNRDGCDREEIIRCATWTKQQHELRCSVKRMRWDESSQCSRRYEGEAVIWTQQHQEQCLGRLARCDGASQCTAEEYPGGEPSPPKAPPKSSALHILPGSDHAVRQCFVKLRQCDRPSPYNLHNGFAML